MFLLCLLSIRDHCSSNLWVREGDANNLSVGPIRVIDFNKCETYDIADASQWKVPIFEIWIEWVSHTPPSRIERHLFGLARGNVGSDSFAIGQRLQICRPGAGKCVGILEVSLSVGADRDSVYSVIGSAAARLKLKSDMKVPRARLLEDKHPINNSIDISENDDSSLSISSDIVAAQDIERDEPRSHSPPIPIAKSPNPVQKSIATEEVNELLEILEGYDNKESLRPLQQPAVASDDFESFISDRQVGIKSDQLPLHRRQLNMSGASSNFNSSKSFDKGDHQTENVGHAKIPSAFTSKSFISEINYLSTSDTQCNTHIMDMSISGCAPNLSMSMSGFHRDSPQNLDTMGYFVFYSLPGLSDGSSEVFFIALFILLFD